MEGFYSEEVERGREQSSFLIILGAVEYLIGIGGSCIVFDICHECN